MAVSKEVEGVPENTHPFGKRVDNVNIRLPPASSELPTLRHATGTGKREKLEILTVIRRDGTRLILGYDQSLTHRWKALISARSAVSNALCRATVAADILRSKIRLHAFASRQSALDFSSASCRFRLRVLPVSVFAGLEARKKWLPGHTKRRERRLDSCHFGESYKGIVRPSPRRARATVTGTSPKAP